MCKQNIYIALQLNQIISSVFLTRPVSLFIDPLITIKHLALALPFPNIHLLHCLLIPCKRPLFHFLSLAVCAVLCALCHSVMWLHVRSLVPGMGSLIQRISLHRRGLESKDSWFCCFKALWIWGKWPFGSGAKNSSQPVVSDMLPRTRQETNLTTLLIIQRLVSHLSRVNNRRSRREWENVSLDSNFDSFKEPYVDPKVALRHKHARFSAKEKR